MWQRCSGWGMMWKWRRGRGWRRGGGGVVQHACKYNRPSLPTVESYGEVARLHFIPLGFVIPRDWGIGC